MTASDPETSIVTIKDNNFAADAVPKQWLARFGRTAVVHVVDALDERMRCPPDRRPVEISPERRPRWRCRPPHREPQSMVIGGHRLASGVNQTEAIEWYEAGHRRDEWMLYDGTLGDWDADALRSLTVNEFLARSSFHVSSEEEEGWRLSYWGRGAFSRFDGHDGGLTLGGGDAETGLGVEIGAGLRYAHPEQYLTMELNSRWQLAHDDDSFAKWGVSGSLRYDPRPPSELGLSFTLSPSWGTGASGGIDALWKRADIAALAANEYATPAGRIDAELAYGFVTLDGLVIGTPLTGVSLSESMRAFRLGYRISLAHREDLDFNLSFEGTRRENTRGDEPPEYGCLLRFSIRW